MAIYVPKQNPDYRVELAKLINGYLAEREWSPARLARESGQSKATISRITNYRKPQIPAIVEDDTGYRPGAEALPRTKERTV